MRSASMNSSVSSADVARRLEIRRLVDPGVAVPHPAESFDDALHLVARDVGGPLEVHVLDPVRDAGLAGLLVAGADAIPAPHRHERRGMNLLDEDLEAIVEPGGPDGRQGERFGHGHGSHYTGRISGGFSRDGRRPPGCRPFLLQ